MANVNQGAKKKKLKSIFNYLILPIFFIISGIVLNEVWEKQKEAMTEYPYIAVVVSQKAIDFPIPGEFLKGFQKRYPENKTFIESKSGKKVNIETLEDLGSTAESARIANALVKDDNCIMVIGNSNSTLTDVTLDIFLRSNNPPTYILPIATDNDLITKAKTAKHGAVLRMVPDNAAQAEAITQLIKQLAPNQRVAIYGDQENEVYSLNLSRDIASRIRSKGGKILIEEQIGPTNSFYNSMDLWFRGNEARNYKYKLKKVPEVIIYAGVAHHALLLIDQFSELDISVPIIFSDGCMVNSLLPNVKKLSNQCFVLSPVGISGDITQMPTYEPIGEDAYILASRIISNCTNCTRKEVRDYITNSKDKIHIKTGVAGEYRFQEDGNNAEGRWKIYEITGGILKLIR